MTKTCHDCKFLEKNVTKKFSGENHFYKYWCTIFGCLTCFNPQFEICEDFKEREKNL